MCVCACVCEIQVEGTKKGRERPKVVLIEVGKKGHVSSRSNREYEFG